MNARCGKTKAKAVVAAPVTPEAAALARLKARGTPPPECGPELVVAPGQAPLIAFYPVVVMVDAKGQEQAIELGYRGRAAARVADVFDLMLSRQRPSHRARHGAVFSPGQVAIARLYRTLFEDIARGNMRGTNLLSAGGGSRGNDDGFLARFSDKRAELAAMRRRVGDGVALAVTRGGGRADILRRDLVDQVCVAQLTLSQVLARAGWAADRHGRAVLRDALCDSLDAMQGFGGRR